MENKSHAFAAGAFVLLVSALLIAMAFWLTRDTGVHRVYELSSREPVTGLQPQAGVRFKGVAVGKVMSIGFDPVTRGNVLIRISTDDGAPITRSTFATLGFQGVTGLAFVQLDDSGEFKDELPTSEATPARIPVRAGLLSKLSDQGVTILAQLEETSRRVNLLLAADNQKTLFSAIQNIGQAAASIQQFSVNADKTLTAQFGSARLNLPALAQEFSGTLKAASVTFDSVGASADEAKDSAREFKQVSVAMSRHGGALDKLAEGAEALTSMGQSLNSGTLPRLNRTSDEATRTARQVTRAVAGINDNPQSLIFGNGATPPGPGEAGFSAPAATPAPKP